jgi:hypothetical protein
MSKMKMTADEITIGGKRYLRRDRYARERVVNPRTIARSGMPYLEWAGAVWIQPEEGDAHIVRGVKRRAPMPRRRARQDQHAT